MKKLALFDIDGVIYEGHSIFDLIQDQEKRGFIKPGLWIKIEGEIGKYKSGEKKYKEAADSMLQYYAQWLKGKKYFDLVEDNIKFIKSNKLVFPYFEKLVPVLGKTHDIYFVTTNFNCTAEAFKEIFKVKGYLSSKLARKDGIMTGTVELSLGGNKGIVSEFVSKYGYKGSIAVGDSENDVDMLDKVEFPFAMEPNEKLKTIAAENGWQIVNGDNIIGIIMSNVE